MRCGTFLGGRWYKCREGMKKGLKTKKMSLGKLGGIVNRIVNNLLISFHREIHKKLFG